jgi:hypothetical protein
MSNSNNKGKYIIFTKTQAKKAYLNILYNHDLAVVS